MSWSSLIFSLSLDMTCIHQEVAGFQTPVECVCMYINISNLNGYVSQIHPLRIFFSYCKECTCLVVAFPYIMTDTARCTNPMWWCLDFNNWDANKGESFVLLVIEPTVKARTSVWESCVIAPALPSPNGSALQLQSNPSRWSHVHPNWCPSFLLWFWWL